MQKRKRRKFALPVRNVLKCMVQNAKSDCLFSFYVPVNVVRHNLFEMEPVLDGSIVYRSISPVSEREAKCNVDYPW
jgi:hypothetical protein